LGLGDTLSRLSPARIDTKSNWASARTGRSTTVARKTDGTIWSWGLNTTGELGQGIDTGTIISSPVQIGTDTNWSVISVGGATTTSLNFRAHVMAIKTNGTLWGWGANGNNNSQAVQSTATGRGRIGDGTIESKSSPVQIGTDTNWATVSAGAVSTTAVKTDIKPNQGPTSNIARIGLG
jgi:alpha-tubulin suppressor-like RCC1 family protein